MSNPRFPGVHFPHRLSKPTYHLYLIWRGNWKRCLDRVSKKEKNKWVAPSTSCKTTVHTAWCSFPHPLHRSVHLKITIVGRKAKCTDTCDGGLRLDLVPPHRDEASCTPYMQGGNEHKKSDHQWEGLDLVIVGSMHPIGIMAGMGGRGASLVGGTREADTAHRWLGRARSRIAIFAISAFEGKIMAPNKC